MAQASESPHLSFEIVAEIEYSDALAATLSQPARKAPAVVAVYVLLAACLAAAALVANGAFVWFAIGWLAPGVTAVGLVAGLTFRDFKARSGRPLRLRYHFCDSGVEIRSGGRSDWIAWDDLQDGCETRRSFLLSPARGEHYVIPKRCCGSAADDLRKVLRASGVGVR